MKSPRGRSSLTRSVTWTQLLTLLLAFLCVSGLAGVLTAGLAIPVAGAAGIAVKSVPEAFNSLPGDLQIIDPSEESTLLDTEGNVIATFYSERRIVVEGKQIPDTMRNAIVAIEDRRFYEHHGIDPEGLVRAALVTVSGRDIQGASTITQQYVRNMLLEKGYQEGDEDLIDEATETSIPRKLREMKYALTLETKLSKQDILTGYLNIAPFGPITYGVEAASQEYFSHPASQLTIVEAALLAGLVQSPVEYDPTQHPDKAQERRDTVLDSMLREGMITQEEHDQAVAVNVPDMLKVDARPQGCAGAGDMAYFCEYAKAEFLRDESYGENTSDRLRLLETGGLTIRSTINPAIQWHARAAATDRINQGDPSEANTAITSLDPQTGAIRAMAQNTEFGIAGDGEFWKTTVNFNTGGEEGRGFQTGSTFKIFTLLEWFREGKSGYESVGSANRTYTTGAFTCADGTVLPVDSDEGAFWRVGDLAGKDGAMNIVRATGMSANQAFVNMASRINICGVFETAAAFGITEPDGSTIAPAPSKIIGAGESTPLKMASAIGAIGNSGNQCKPRSLAQTNDRDGNTIKEYKPDCPNVYDAMAAQKTTTVLNQSVSQYYKNVTLDGGRPWAGKSGTTDNNANTWLVGYTPQLATAAWVGTAAASQRPLNDIVINGQYYGALYGQDFVGPMWKQFMDGALAGAPFVEIPNVPL